MKLTIKRYDPSKDNAPYDVTYEVPHDDEYMTLLQALVYVHENEEPLAFDFSCRGRMCGRCAMMMDGKPVLACVEPIDDGNHTVEPLEGVPVIKGSSSWTRARCRPASPRPTSVCASPR